VRTWFRNTEYRYRTANFIAVFALIALIASAFFYPIWTGEWISYDFWRLRMWLPSWI